MEWKTVYDMGEPYSIIWDDLLVIIVCIVAGINLFLTVQTIMKRPKRYATNKEVVKITLLNMLILFGILSIAFKWIDFKINDFHPLVRTHDEIFLIIIGLFSVLKLIAEIQEKRRKNKTSKNKTKNSAKQNIRIMFYSILIFLVILSFPLKWVAYRASAYYDCEKAYDEGTLEVVTGIAEDIIWSRGGFFFTVDSVKFDSDIESSIKRDKAIEPYFNKGYQLRIHYFGEEYANEEKHYCTEDCWLYCMPYKALRIDVLIEEIPTE